MRNRLFIILCLILFFVPTYIYAHKQNNLLDGINIVLDAGHGGMDKGASYKNVDEAPINLLITKKLEKKLQKLGSKVILTRKDDEDLSKNSTFHKREDMKERVRIINDEKNDLFISIHMNKFDDESVKGLHVFYNNDSTQSQELAQMIQQQLNIALKQEKQIKKGDFYILKNSRIPGVLIECGFLSNGENRMDLQNEKYQDQLVNSIVDGINLYFEKKGLI